MMVFVKLCNAPTTSRLHRHRLARPSSTTSSGSSSRASPRVLVDPVLPAEPVERGQMASFLERAPDLPGTPNDYFVDDDGEHARDRRSTALARPTSSGCCGVSLLPDNSVTRGQMASFLAARARPAGGDPRLLRRRQRASLRGRHQPPRRGGHRQRLRTSSRTARAGPSPASRWPRSSTARFD